MHEKDMKLASKISDIVSHYPDVWQKYQDWLRDIVASWSLLQQRHPTWQAVLIFRWRLLYFAGYVGTVILFNMLLERLNGLPAASRALKDRFISTKDTIGHGLMAQFAPYLPATDQYRYILQRTATLLAVAELTLCGVAAFTGILLAFYYQPTAMGAYESLSAIARHIPNGTLILSLHHVAGHGLIGLALVQLVVMFLGRAFLPSWLTGWISGILLTLSAISLSWTAIVLKWNQTGFWRFRLELNIIASIPVIGSGLRDILSGGVGISSITVQHMYTLHSYVLAIAAILLSIIHLMALIVQEQDWKPVEKRLSFSKFCGESTPNSDPPST